MRRRASAILFAVTILLAPSAQAQTSVADRLLNPADPQTLSAQYPPLAAAHGIRGRAVLECTVRIDSETDCALLEEEPADFGEAALRVAEPWRMTPIQENGIPVEDVVRFPMRFAAYESGYGTPPIYPDLTVDGVSADERPVSPEELASTTTFYPPRARAAGIAGRALIACISRPDGALDCATEREQPEGYDFGGHAKRVILAATPPDSAARQPGNVFRIAVDFALAAQGQTPARPERWESEPRPQDVERFYPRSARAAGVEASVQLGCVVNADRTLTCEAIHSSVPDRGFENAARLAARDYRLSADVLGTPGRSVGDRLLIHVSFEQR